MADPPVNLLLIEDDPSFALLVDTLLREEGEVGPFEIQHVTSLKAGFEKMAERAPHAVLLDLHLPDSQGLETVTRFRAQAGSTPVIVLTGVSDSDAGPETLRRGAQDYICKRDADGLVLWRAVSYAIERERLRVALRESRERFELVIRGSTDGIWDWNLLTNKCFFSPRWKGLLGYADDEVGDSLEEWESRLHPDEREEALAAVRRYLDGDDATFFLEHRLKHKDGTYRWIVARGVALRDENGKAYRMAGAHVDITERKAREVELHAANDALRRLNEELRTTQMRLVQAEKMRSLGRMSAGIAHEVKNPLATIEMGVEYLKHAVPDKDDAAGKVLMEMHEAIRRADTIVKGLLDYSAPMTLQLQENSLNALARESLVLVKHELQKNGVKAVTLLDEGLPDVELDGNKIKQVLVNLLTNAVHAMPGGGVVTITTHVTPVSAVSGEPDGGGGSGVDAGLVVGLDVDDEGSGIDEGEIDRIFDLFYTTKPTGEGTGIGLAVARGIIELHGGGIAVSNREEGGVRVSIRMLV